MRHRPLLAGAAGLALVLSLTACGDDGDDESTDTTTTEAESSDTEDTAAEPEDTEAETTEDTEAETEDTEAETTEAEGEATDLTALLVTPEDVGEGFVEQPYETSEEATPCGAELDTDYPTEEIAGVTLVEEELQLFLQHEIRTYADEAGSAEVFAAAQTEGFGCGAETTVEGLVLGDVTDVSSEIGADAFAVQVTSEADGVEGALVVVMVGPALSVFQFQGPSDVEEGPDPAAIITENTAALQAALG